MYDELYVAWKMETENPELGSLTSDFYARLAEYLRHIKEEAKMQDSAATVRTKLLDKEGENATKMVRELTEVRFRKIGKLIVSGHQIPLDFLAAEERKFVGGVAPSADALKKFSETLTEGKLASIEIEAQPIEMSIPRTRMTLRFLKPVPAIVGIDMKTYGPFQVEDVASVPSENARVLVKQGYARAVEVE